MNRLAYLTSLAALVLPAFLWAGTAGEATKTAVAQKKWNLSLSGGLTLNTGNTRSLLVTGGTRIQYRSDKLQYLTTADVFYGTGKQEKLVNKGNWSHKLILSPGHRFSTIGVASVEYDKFSDVGIRGSGGLGVRWEISNPTDTSLTAKLAATLNGEWTRTLNTKETTGSMRMNIDASVDKTMSETANYSMSALFTSGLDDFFGDFRLETRASLSLKIKNPFSLKVEIHDKYTHRPLAPGIKRNDFILITSLEVSF